MGLLEIEEELEQLTESEEEKELERKEISQLTIEELRNELLLYKTAVSSFLERGPENQCWNSWISILGQLKKVSCVFPLVRQIKRTCQPVTCAFKDKWQSCANPNPKETRILQLLDFHAGSESLVAQLTGETVENVSFIRRKFALMTQDEDTRIVPSKVFDFEDSLRSEISETLSVLQQHKYFKPAIKFGPLTVTLSLQLRHFTKQQPCLIIEKIEIPVEERSKGYFTAFLRVLIDCARYTPYRALFFDFPVERRFRNFFKRFGFKQYREGVESKYYRPLYCLLQMTEDMTKQDYARARYAESMKVARLDCVTEKVSA